MYLTLSALASQDLIDSWGSQSAQILFKGSKLLFDLEMLCMHIKLCPTSQYKIINKDKLGLSCAKLRTSLGFVKLAYEFNFGAFGMGRFCLDGLVDLVW